MTASRCLAAAAIAAFATAAGAATQHKGFFKGKVKEGLYEQTVEFDFGDMPGMPKGRQVEKGQECVTADDLAKGIEPQKNCATQNFKPAGNTLTFTVVCKPPQEATTDVKMSFTSTSYVSEMKITRIVGGKPTIAFNKISGKYLGPCKKK